MASRISIIRWGTRPSGEAAVGPRGGRSIKLRFGRDEQTNQLGLGLGSIVKMQRGGAKGVDGSPLKTFGSPNLHSRPQHFHWTNLRFRTAILINNIY